MPSLPFLLTPARRLRGRSGDRGPSATATAAVAANAAPPVMSTHRQLPGRTRGLRIARRICQPSPSSLQTSAAGAGSGGQGRGAADKRSADSPDTATTPSGLSARRPSRARSLRDGQWCARDASPRITVRRSLAPLLPSVHRAPQRASPERGCGRCVAWWQIRRGIVQAC